MPAELLTRPPDLDHLWIPPDALPGITILYTPGRNSRNADGRFSYLDRGKRSDILIEISHTMGGPGLETPQSFANSEMPPKETLAEIATFTDGTVLQSLPLDIIGQGSVVGSLTGLTHESAEEAGNADEIPWNPVHMRTKVLLTAWLIRNPLFAAGDRRWGKLQIRYQLCKSPTPARPEDGGLGDHTMWNTAASLNPWSIFTKTCPGVRRRGTDRPVQFPNGLITDISFEPGNFRDYFEQVGRQLDGSTTQVKPVDLTGDDDMPTHRWSPKGFFNQFEMPGCLPVTPADVADVGAGNVADPFAALPLITEFHLHRLLAVIHRNGVSQQQITAGYFVRDNNVDLTAGEREAYQNLGIPV